MSRIGQAHDPPIKPPGNHLGQAQTEPPEQTTRDRHRPHLRTNYLANHLGQAQTTPGIGTDHNLAQPGTAQPGTGTDHISEKSIETYAYDDTHLKITQDRHVRLHTLDFVYHIHILFVY